MQKVVPKTPPDISHLTAEQILKIMKESSAIDVERTSATVKMFLDNKDLISSIDTANIDKISKLMGSVAGDGACGSLTCGCC